VGFWLRWALASGAGGGLLALAFGAGARLPSGQGWLGVLGLPAVLAGMLAWPVLVITAPQWWVLRRVIPRAFRWVLGTYFGLVGALMAQSTATPWVLAWLDGTWASMILFGIVGAVLGAIQAVVLGGRSRPAGIWVAASGAAWATIAVVLILLLGADTGAWLDRPDAAIVAGSAAGSAYGGITGLLLTRLLLRSD
jgi:hypothetical protein